MDREDKGIGGRDFKLQEHDFHEYEEMGYEGDYEEEEWDLTTTRQPSMRNTGMSH